MKVSSLVPVVILVAEVALAIPAAVEVSVNSCSAIQSISSEY